MVEAVQNEACRDYDDCWQCGKCRSHHESEYGAEQCCSDKDVDLEKCSCRHCKKDAPVIAETSGEEGDPQ